MVLHSTCGERKICTRAEKAEKGQIKRKWSVLLLSYCTLRHSSSLVSPTALIIQITILSQCRKWYLWSMISLPYAIQGRDLQIYKGKKCIYLYKRLFPLIVKGFQTSCLASFYQDKNDYVLDVKIGEANPTLSAQKRVRSKQPCT